MILSLTQNCEGHDKMQPDLLSQPDFPSTKVGAEVARRPSSRISGRLRSRLVVASCLQGKDFLSYPELLDY